MRSGKTKALAITALICGYHNTKTHHCDRIITITIENLKKKIIFFFGKLIKPKIQKVEVASRVRVMQNSDTDIGWCLLPRQTQTDLLIFCYLWLFIYIFTLSSLAVWCVWKFRTLVVNGDATERPLVNKLCDINTHNMIEGCFSFPFFNLFIFISTYWPLEMTNQQTATIGQ